MKSVTKSELEALLARHRDNDLYVEFEGYEIPIKGVYYSSRMDQIRITLDPAEVYAVKMLIKEKPLREKINKSDAEMGK